MLEELQSLDDKQKRRVLVVATIIIMVIVVGVWILYFNSIVIGDASQPVAATSSVATTTGADGSIAVPVPAPATTTTVTASGAAPGPSLWQDIKNLFAGFGKLFSNPSQYNIQPNQ
ncbi:MAG TPA: hypothetical protein VMA75_04885 [Candidatus Paceibacterota bacterium]|nr:hypothetical protein [Candidatus Paceibacterota bacterium]